MASDFMAPGAVEPSCTIIRTLQPNVLWPAGLEMMKSIDFWFPQGTNTPGCGLKESELSYNQRFFFKKQNYRLFEGIFSEFNGSLEIVQSGMLDNTAPGFAGGGGNTKQSHLLLRSLKNCFFLAEMSHVD